MNNLFICAICGLQFTKKTGFTRHLKVHNISKKQYFDSYIEPFFHKCPFCDRERTWHEDSYNMTCASKECFKKQLEITKMERYGDAHFNNKEQHEKTMLNRYGVKSNFSFGPLREAALKMNELKNGSRNYRNFEKNKKTCMERYGVEYATKNEEVIQKRIKTYNDRHGGVGFASKEIVEKYKITCRAKYGVDRALDNLEIMKKVRTCVMLDGLHFRSKTELKLYTFLLELGIDFKYQPTRIEYYDSNGLRHYYFPDFEICGKLVEVKGRHLIKNGKLHTPFTKGLTQDRIDWNIRRDEAKTKCMNENNVVIITDDKLKNLGTFINNYKEEFNL